ncbi:IPT/TIG domain-containing protein [Flagellimonas myxillae]|uniref:Kelch repeat-containing protein n=1 Tax=Flagellimonas myxillae TaxID=2942214 RepID=UPI00201F1532|nr:IPT/TIG domain-containing protein [Muricauda myxillae]MCL6268305.1 IPT/TIG domain-containing protein [Muricauda myxillae]
MGKNTLNYLATILFCFLLIACGKDDSPDKPDTPSNDPPEITNVDPYEGVIGDDVDLIGENFSATTSENTVKFGNVDATVNNATTTKLDVTVPDGAETAKITVTVNNQTAISENEFVVNDPSPKIQSFTPMEGGPGTEVTITGIGLEANYGLDNYNISFSGNGAEPEVISVSDSELVVVVPGSLTTGPISIYLNGETIVSEDDFTPTAWTRKKDFPGGKRFLGIAQSDNGKIYAGLGLDDDLNPKEDFWEFDPNENNWTQKANFPGGLRYAAGSFTINGLIYVIGGSDNTSVGINDVWSYDSENDTWTQLGDFGPDINQRKFSVCFSLNNGKGYLYGGEDKNGILYGDNLWEYDPGSDTWTEQGVFPGGSRIGAIGLAIADKGYIALVESDNSYLKDLWEYNPDDDSWTELDSFPANNGRKFPIGFASDSDLYIGMGAASGVDWDDFWIYETMPATWSERNNFPGDFRFGGVGVFTGTNGYLGLGRYGESTFYEDFWEYYPVYDQE